ncbi:MAG: hypothetical protein WCO13_06335 [Bacteroidota bacterium]
MSKNKVNDYLKQTFINQTKGYIDVSLKRELWQKISIEFKGKFKISHNSGNELEILKITIPYKNWEINISESDTRPMKFEISFGSQIEYELIIGFEDSIEKILKRLGKKEVEVGNEMFDKKYLLKSQNSEITRKILQQDIIDGFLKFNIYSLAYTTDTKRGTSKLISVISRTVEDILTMGDLIKLYMRIIDKLIEIKLIE